MGVELVAVALSVDVRPGVGLPGDLDRPAVAVGGQPVGGGAGLVEQAAGRLAAPLLQIPGRLPAAEVAVPGARMTLGALEDAGLERGVEALAFGDFDRHHRRREHRVHLDRFLAAARHGALRGC